MKLRNKMCLALAMIVGLVFMYPDIRVYGEIDNSACNEETPMMAFANATKELNRNIIDQNNRALMEKSRMEITEDVYKEFFGEVAGKHITFSEPIELTKDISDLQIGTGVLRVRSGPGYNYDAVDLLSEGTPVDVVSAYRNTISDDIWLGISYEGERTGYVHMDYIKKAFRKTEKSLGIFHITYYCACEECCGSYADGITASGRRAVQGRTVAADPSIPFGTKLKVDGNVYTVEDRGGMITGNHLDIYMDSHEAALNMRTKNVEVLQIIE